MKVTRQYWARFVIFGYLAVIPAAAYLLLLRRVLPDLPALRWICIAIVVIHTFVAIAPKLLERIGILSATDDEADRKLLAQRMNAAFKKVAAQSGLIERIRQAEERLRNTPPRCLTGFKLGASKFQNIAFDGHGEPLNKVYHLICGCGHDRFRVMGHSVRNDRGVAVFVSPLGLECAKCGMLTELIDTDQHGYDAELGHGSATMRGEGRRTPFTCQACGKSEMTAHARFEHAPDTLQDSTGLFTGREHDLFTWFSLVGQCAECDQLLRVADFECA